MMKHLKSILTLFVICAIVSVALAAVNGVTAPIILERQQQAAAGALLEVMPDGGTFEKVDLSTYELPATVKEAHKASNGGYVLQIEWAGFNPGNVTMVGVGADGKVTGTKTITVKDSGGNGKDSAAEIPAMDANGYYNGADITTIEGVDTVAGVTVSTKAYRAAVKDALAAATILGGGSVDLRDPEEILNDNLNAALGTEGVEFEKHFVIQVLEGVDAVYKATDRNAYVVVIGEEFHAVTFDDTTVTGNNDVAVAAVTAIRSTQISDFDTSGFSGVSKRVKSVQITDAGVYIFEVEGSGFGKKGSSDYGASGEYIVIRVAITADGKILDCFTVYQNESAGFGDVCATEEFYGQFAGKDQSNYTDIIIAGSTYTTEGYHGAIKNAYKALAIFNEGGAQ